MTDGKQVFMFGLLLLAAACALLGSGCAHRVPPAASYCVVHHYDGCPRYTIVPCPGGRIVYTGVQAGTVYAARCFYGNAARSL